MYKTHYFSPLTISTFENLSETESSDSKLSLSHNKIILLHEWEMESDDEPVNETEKAPGQLPPNKIDIFVSKITLDDNLFNDDEVIISKLQTFF